jgi:hypothetical protein
MGTNLPLGDCRHFYRLVFFIRATLLGLNCDLLHDLVSIFEQVFFYPGVLTRNLKCLLSLKALGVVNRPRTFQVTILRFLRLVFHA